jgi:hypothetical protein
MAIRTYNAADVTISVDGQLITGVARDTFVKVEHDEVAFSKKVSADGITSRAKSNNYTGKITFTVNQTSDGNEILQVIHERDKTLTDGVVEIKITDNSGNSNHVAAEGWSEKQPASEYGAEEKEREWVFDCGEINMMEAGNVV